MQAVYGLFPESEARLADPSSYRVVGRIAATVLTFQFVSVGWVLSVPDAPADSEF